MGNELNCEIVRDLLPNYMEKLTGDLTNESIREHLDGCEACSRIYRQMGDQVTAETAPEVMQVKKYLKKTRAIYISMSLAGLGILGILTCFIVNLAVDRKLSWSLIVTGSIAYAFAVGGTFVKARRNKIARTLLVSSILLIPFLALLQGVLYFTMDQPGLWIRNGVTLGLIWIVIAWISYAVCARLKCNAFHSIAIILLLCGGGSFWTNWIMEEHTFFHIMINLITVGSNFVLAAILGIAGIWYDKKKKGEKTRIGK